MTERLKIQLLEQLQERGLDKKHNDIIRSYLEAIEDKAQRELLALFIINQDSLVKIQSLIERKVEELTV